MLPVAQTVHHHVVRLMNDHRGCGKKQAHPDLM